MRLSKLPKYLRAGYFLLRNCKKNQPFFVAIEITGDCNLRCVYCSFGQNPQKPKEYLSCKEWERIISYFIQNGAAYVSFIGGEPFLRKDLLFQLVAGVGKKAITSVITNGTLVTGNDLKKFRELALDTICFSVHTREDLNRNILLAVKAKKLGLIALLSIVVHSRGMELWRNTVEACIKHNIILCFNLCQQFDNSQTASNLIRNIITPKDRSEVVLMSERLFMQHPHLIRNSNEYLGIVRRGKWHCDHSRFTRIHVNHRGFLNACTAWGTNFTIEEWDTYQSQAKK